MSNNSGEIEGFGDIRNGARKVLNRIFGGDKAVWAVTVIMLVISVFVAYSALAYKERLSSTDQLIDQLKMVGAGIVVLFGASFFRYQWYRPLIKTGYIVSLGLTVAMLIWGTEVGGVKRSLPLFGIEFQPFELLKIMVVLMLADALARRQKIIDTTPMIPNLCFWRWFKDPKRKDINTIIDHTLPLLAPMAIACLVTLKTSNSTTLIIAVSCFVMLFIGRMQMKDLGKLLLVLSVAGVLAFTLLSNRDDTGKSRLSGLQPNMFKEYVVVESDGLPYYHNPNESEQATNAKMSIATGGLFGKGPGMSTHRSLLQEAESDMVYAFLIEEYGALGGLLVMLLFLILFYRSIQIFQRCGTAFPSLVVLGLTMIITLQAFMHMMVSVALFPLTGQQLPLISKGGTSLLFTLASIGMILNISRQTETKTHDRPKDESLLENNKTKK